MSPERSSANVRLSDTVSTAMRTGVNATLSSIGTECPSVRIQSYRCLSLHAGKARPQAPCEAGKAACLFTRLLLLHPVIPHDDGDRKSVVSGRSVSVRDDLGGSR